MPFTKTKYGMYKSPSGRKMSKAQVQAYYASKNDKKKTVVKKKK